MDYTEEFEMFVKAYEKSGYLSDSLLSPKYARLIVNEDKILDKKEIDGISIKTRYLKGTLYAKIKVDENVKPAFPIHLCFGVLKEEFLQKIKVSLEVGDGADVKMISHCFFPNSENVKHIMVGDFVIGKNASFVYEEEHFHGKKGAYVKLDLNLKARENGKYKSVFKTKKGVIGKLDVVNNGVLEKKASAEICTKVHGKKNDEINILEKLKLKGDYSKGLLESRVAATGNSKCEVKSVIIGEGKYSMGHVDCTEIIEGNGKVSAIPIVEVKEKTARITHEASLGRVNKKQLEALMIKGLTEKEAVDVIINGMLR